MAAFARERDPLLAVRHERRDAEAGAGPEHGLRSGTRRDRATERARLVGTQRGQRVRDRLEIVDRMDALEAEALGELTAIEAPVAVGELDLAARDRPRHRQHGGARREAGLVEIAADRRLGAGHRLVVDDRHALRPAARPAHREAGGAAADVGEENAVHTPDSHASDKCERGELFRDRNRHGRA